MICLALAEQQTDSNARQSISERDLIESLNEYLSQNAFYIVYQNTTNLLGSKPMPVLMELFVTPLLTTTTHRFATIIIRIVQLIIPPMNHPLMAIYHQLVEYFNSRRPGDNMFGWFIFKPFANLTVTFGFNTNFQASSQFGLG